MRDFWWEGGEKTGEAVCLSTVLYLEAPTFWQLQPTFKKPARASLAVDQKGSLQSEQRPRHSDRQAHKHPDTQTEELLASVLLDQYSVTPGFFYLLPPHLVLSTFLLPSLSHSPPVPFQRIPEVPILGPHPDQHQQEAWFYSPCGPDPVPGAWRPLRLGEAPPSGSLQPGEWA